MKGVVNLNKPKGWTSRDAVNKVRNLLRVKDAGHFGTLDPQGEGVLLIGIGKATRLFDPMLKKDKVYRADFAFGYETDTLDCEGKILKTTNTIPTAAEIENKLPSFIGKLMQIPPQYSAKSVGGVRAYQLARRGEKVELVPSEVEIFSARLVADKGNGVFEIELHCSAGTYVRSVCRDLAYSLGSLATMTSITRLRVGSFTLEKSVTIEDIERLGESVLTSCDEAVRGFPGYEIPAELYDKIISGVKFYPKDAPEPPFAVYCKGELFGLGEVVDEVLKIKTYLRD